MSIATYEAEGLFPLPEGHGAFDDDDTIIVKVAAYNRQFNRAKGYVMGRTATPTREEAIAVAKMGIEQDNREGYGWEAWDLIPEDNKELLIEDGLEMLNAAREEVAHA